MSRRRSAGPIRVLVVVHHAEVTATFRRVLAADGIDVVGVAATAVEGLALTRALGPDVVLMDSLLPDGDGVRAATRLRDECPDVKVVLLTAGSADGTVSRAVAACCAGYVEKATALEHLVPTVRAVVAGDVVIRAAHVARLVQRDHGGALTPRERDVLLLLAEGLTNKEVALRMSLSVNTVRTHVQSVLEKLGAQSKLEALATARRQGLLS